jgi:tetratricopeptide (TPR) repeat protein
MASRSFECSYEERKERGNCCFRERQYESACAEYSAAIACADSDAHRAVALNNRALARLEMGEHAGAVEDCTAALVVDPANVCRPPSFAGVVSVQR